MKTKYNFNSILLVALFLVSINTEGLTQKGLVEIIQESNRSPFVNLLLVYDTATQTGKQLHQYIPMITAPKKDYYKVHHLDCNTDDMQLIKTFPYCAKQNRQKLPALLYTEPPLNRIDPQTGATNEAKQHQYQGTLSDKSLFDFAVPLMKAFSISLKKVKDFNSFVENNNEVPNIVYFTDKDKLPTIFKALTARFRNTIAFGHSMKDSQLATHFNITKYPTMMFNGKQEIPLSKNLTEMIQRLETIEGQHTQIVVAEFTEGLQELNSQNLQKLVYELPQHILIHVSDSSGEVHPQWKKCQQNFRNMFKYYETQTLSKQLGVKQTPAIVYFPKSLAKKSVQKSVFFPKDTFRTIYDEVASLIQDFTVPLANDMQMQKLTSIPLQQGKFIAVLFHEEEISLSYRVLSNDQDYKKDIVFFRMKDPQASVLQKFKINKLPALYVMMNNQEEEVQGKKKKKQEDLPEGRMQMNLQIAQYTGKFNFDDLTKYFSMFSKKPKVTQQPTSQHTQSVNIPQIDSLKQFQKHCIDENCYILLVDGRQSHKQSNQNYLNEIKKFAGRVNSNFAVLDAVCHAEILTPLDIQLEELPVFIHLNGKFEKYARLIGRIEEKTLNGFIAKTRANKANYRAFNNLQFDDLKDCSQEHRKLDQYQSGTDSEPALDAAQLQILKEIQQQEKKKQQQAKIQKQNEKNEKKKKRKRRPKGQEDSYDL